jgi:hypothetical protein
VGLADPLTKWRPDLEPGVNGDLNRDGLKTVSGLDESGHMDAMGLGWVGMMDKDRPSILQKAGGLQGTFTHIAFAPTRGTAVLIATTNWILAPRWPWVNLPMAYWSNSPRADQAAWEAASSVSTA